ncbi:MAG: hypothetical protein H7831_17540 [Magnetococcus sp. WYHC-3]
MTKIYQMYDRLAEQAGPIFEAVNDAVALRGTEKHRQANDDLELHCVGERTFNDVGIIGYETTILVWEKEFVKKVAENEK